MNWWFLQQDKLPWYAEKWRDIKEILPCVWCIFMGNSTHSLLLVIIALNIISYHSPNHYISSLGVHYWDHILLDSGIGFRWEINYQDHSVAFFPAVLFGICNGTKQSVEFCNQLTTKQSKHLNTAWWAIPVLCSASNPIDKRIPIICFLKIMHVSKFAVIIVDNYEEKIIHIKSGSPAWLNPTLRFQRKGL